jgi:hypothetical protein
MSSHCIVIPSELHGVRCEQGQAAVYDFVSNVCSIPNKEVWNAVRYINIPTKAIKFGTGKKTAAATTENLALIIKQLTLRAASRFREKHGEYITAMLQGRIDLEKDIHHLGTAKFLNSHSPVYSDTYKPSLPPSYKPSGTPAVTQHADSTCQSEVDSSIRHSRIPADRSKSAGTTKRKSSDRFEEHQYKKMKLEFEQLERQIVDQSKERKLKVKRETEEHTLRLKREAEEYKLKLQREAIEHKKKLQLLDKQLQLTEEEHNKKMQLQDIRIKQGSLGVYKQAVELFDHDTLDDHAKWSLNDFLHCNVLNTGNGQSGRFKWAPDLSTLIPQAGFRLPRKNHVLASLGKFVKKAYMKELSGGTNPKTVQKYVNKSLRDVCCYEYQHSDWLKDQIRHFATANPHKLQPMNIS